MKKNTDADLLSIHRAVEKYKTILEEEYDSVIRDCIAIYKLLGDIEKHTFIELLRRYEIYKEYYHLTSQLAKLLEQKLSKYSSVVLLPVARKIGEAKSGHAVGYTLKTLLSKRVPDKKIFSCDNHKSNDIKPELGSQVIVLVDDFIGTGKQTIAYIKELESFFKKAIYDKLIVASLVMHEEGTRAFDQIGIKYSFTIKHLKAISSNTDLSELEKIERKTTISNISSILGIEKDYVLGFDNSEALITMQRTPNNTIGLFWKEHNSGKETRPPFRR